VTPYVAVVGPSDADEQCLDLARAVGAALAERGAILLTGGLGGVMAAGSRGAAERGGTVVGLLPGLDRREANPFVTIAIPTGLGQLRNGIVVNAADGVVAVGSSWGTVNEVSLALRTGKPVVWLRGHAADGLAPAPRYAGDAVNAVEQILSLLAQRTA
jgi:uncharacterized protein (TIGR00725 family)